MNKKLKELIFKYVYDLIMKNHLKKISCVISYKYKIKIKTRDPDSVRRCALEPATRSCHLMLTSTGMGKKRCHLG